MRFLALETKFLSDPSEDPCRLILRSVLLRSTKEDGKSRLVVAAVRGRRLVSPVDRNDLVPLRPAIYALRYCLRRRRALPLIFISAPTYHRYRV